MRIGILGGTFDPIHRGHLHLALEARRKLDLDRIFFITAYLPPHKAGKRKPITPAALRFRMVCLALAGIPDFKSLAIEVKKKRKVYTVETLRELRRRYPSAQFYLLTGADNLSILGHWKNLTTIMRLARFVVAPRPGFKIGRLRKGILWLPVRPLRISASDIRMRARQGKRFSHLLPKRVAEFIKSKHLYRRR